MVGVVPIARATFDRWGSVGWEGGAAGGAWAGCESAAGAARCADGFGGVGREWAVVQGRPGSGPTISVPHPLHQPPKTRSVLLAVALVACQEFDPDDADLSGTWLLSDSTVFPLPEGPFNTCLMRNVRLEVDPGPPAECSRKPGREGPCNARSMVYGGSRYHMTPLITIHYRISRDGQRIVFVFSNHSDTIYTGHLGSNDRMGGPVHPQGHGGRLGSWRAVRH
jgi:hypothetical protein